MERFDLNNGHMGLSSIDTLYSYNQKVFIKSKKGEEKSKILRMIVEIKSGLTISLGKVLSLQITDDNDCTFFYSLLLTQEDFSVLKCQEGLLVDFDHFPTQLIKLLEACRGQEFNKFILVLDEEDIISPIANEDFIYLKVIETNNFKNLCHLSLKVLKGSDTDIKNHMSLKISNLTERLLEEEKKCRKIEISLTEALKALDAKTKELTEFQLKLTEEKNNLRLESSQQISEEREKFSKLQMEWQQKLDIEKSQQAMQYQKQLSELNEQISSLTFNNKNLYETKCHFEACVKEKNFQMEALEKQVLQLTQDVTLLRKQNSQLDQDYHEKDKAVVGLRTKLAVVEQELKDKIKYLEKQQELLKVANEQKTFLEEALNEKELHLQKKQAAVQTLSADLIKSNEIIAKLQTDLTANRAKMKLRTDIALEQEKIIDKKTQQIATQMETIKEFEEKLENVKAELYTTRAKLEEANKKVEEKELTIKKNENVINWLNRRLTESTSTPNSANLPSTNRSDLMFATVSQPKGSISNLSKGWPPWLANSVAGNNSLQGDSTGTSDSTNRIQSRPSSSYTVEMLQDQAKNRLPKLDDEVENKDTKDDTKSNSSGSKSRGLDPKYFQSCVDKEFLVNPQVLKMCSGKDEWKSSNCKSITSSSKPTSGRQPTSAYFPKKPVQL